MRFLNRPVRRYLADEHMITVTVFDNVYNPVVETIIERYIIKDDLARKIMRMSPSFYRTDCGNQTTFVFLIDDGIQNYIQMSRDFEPLEKDNLIRVFKPL